MQVKHINYRFDGSADYKYDVSNTIKHAADGSQVDTYRITTSTKGVENGLAFDYAVTVNGTCSYAATTKAETCTNTQTSLTGTIAGKSVNATLTQPNPNVTLGISTYEIAQGTQKITATLSWTEGIFTITTANGTPLAARYVNLAYINGY